VGAISIKNSDKNIEYTDLEAHVLMGQHRYKVLEDRIARAEAEIDKINEHTKANRRLIIGAVASILSGICLSLFSYFLKG
jgi:hypothetical protein